MRIVKQVIFNDDKSIDEEMLEFVNDKTFSTYVKELILKDIQQNKNSNGTNREELKGILKELIQEMDLNTTGTQSEDETVIEGNEEHEGDKSPNLKLDGLNELTF